MLVISEPQMAENLALKSRKADELTVEWEEPSKGTYDKFLVKIQSTDDSEEVTKNNDGTYEANFDNLAPGTEFPVEVVTVSADQQSDALIENFFTGE